MDLIIDPPRGVGPIAIGMPFEQAQQALQVIPGFAPPGPRRRVAVDFAHYESEMSIAIEQDRSRNVRAIEVYRPAQDVNVLYRDISLFGVAADQVIRRLSELVHLEIGDEGRHVVARELFLSMERHAAGRAG